MAENFQIIARIRSPFPEKFGIPRQSGLVQDLQAQVVFEPPFRNSDALRGLEAFSHIWLIWQFSRSLGEGWSPTVRPPRLGGNSRMGVFATRSPFRPNPIGLSSVVLEQIQWQSPQGPILHIRGADLMDGTPIYDIKPYLPYCDCHPQAKGGFTDAVPRTLLQVDFPPALLQQVEPAQQQALLGVLAQDPRPSYQSDPQRIYGLAFGPWNVRFSVNGQQLSVLALERRRAPSQEEG